MIINIIFSDCFQFNILNGLKCFYIFGASYTNRLYIRIIRKTSKLGMGFNDIYLIIQYISDLKITWKEYFPF